jgi:hypothetical protein
MKSNQSSDYRCKAKEINLVLSEPDVNLWKLRELALTDGGLVNGRREDLLVRIVGFCMNDLVEFLEYVSTVNVFCFLFLYLSFLLQLFLFSTSFQRKMHHDLWRNIQIHYEKELGLN